MQINHLAINKLHLKNHLPLLGNRKELRGKGQRDSKGLKCFCLPYTMLNLVKFQVLHMSTYVPPGVIPENQTRSKLSAQLNVVPHKGKNKNGYMFLNIVSYVEMSFFFSELDFLNFLENLKPRAKKF